MAKPYYHARSSAKQFGGAPEDYQKIHDFFDSSKAHVPDVRHRSLLHSSFGIFMVEQVFGTTITNSAGRQVIVRDIGEQHVMEDMGFIPTVEWWLSKMPIEDKMMGKVYEKKKTTRVMKFID